MRNLKQIRNLHISELTDQEIVKAAVDRLKCQSAVLIYYDQNNNIAWLSRWNGKFPEGKKFLNWLKKSLELKIKHYQKI